MSHIKEFKEMREKSDFFHLGLRECLITTVDGCEIFEQIPLEPQDLVYSQEGDVTVEGFPHFAFLSTWTAPIRCYLEKHQDVIVTSSVILVLHHDRKNSAPDLAVLEGDFDLVAIEGAIDLRAIVGRLIFVLEAVSITKREIEEKDLKINLRRYAAEGVEEYFTIYPISGCKVANLVGRRLGSAGEYVEIAPDAQGRVASKKLGLVFSIDPQTEELVVTDVETGQRLWGLEES